VLDLVFYEVDRYDSLAGIAEVFDDLFGGIYFRYPEFGFAVRTTDKHPSHLAIAGMLES
jgi:hypothetical protein